MNVTVICNDAARTADIVETLQTYLGCGVDTIQSRRSDQFDYYGSSTALFIEHDNEEFPNNFPIGSMKDVKTYIDDAIDVLKIDV